MTVHRRFLRSSELTATLLAALTRERGNPIHFKTQVNYKWKLIQNGFHIICSEYVVSKPFAFTCCQFIQNYLHTTEFALDVGRENMANAIAVIK